MAIQLLPATLIELEAQMLDEGVDGLDGIPEVIASDYLTPSLAVGDTVTVAAVKIKKPQAYVNNKALLEEFDISIKQDAMTPKLAKMVMMICQRYARKVNFASYTYNEDMQGFAMMNLVKSWRGFNPQKSQNPFAYFTTCVTNSFLQYLNHERKHRNIRDALLVDNGLDPSYTFTEAYNTPEPPDVSPQTPPEVDVTTNGTTKPKKPKKASSTK
jgi:DNA-directed RNA polymerase specialized sigma24 family protein